jgi:hypothetical protein
LELQNTLRILTALCIIMMGTYENASASNQYSNLPLDEDTLRMSSVDSPVITIDPEGSPRRFNCCAPSRWTERQKTITFVIGVPIAVCIIVGAGVAGGILLCQGSKNILCNAMNSMGSCFA